MNILSYEVSTQRGQGQPQPGGGDHRRSRRGGDDGDDTIKATHGYQKQGAGYGYCADLMVMPTLTPIALGGNGSAPIRSA